MKYELSRKGKIYWKPFRVTIAGFSCGVFIIVIFIYNIVMHTE